MKLPNPFNPELDFVFSSAAIPSAVEGPTGIVGDASVPVGTPLPPEPVAAWKPDEDFLDRLYAEIVGADDAMPVFLRKPSPAFIRTLIEMGR